MKAWHGHELIFGTIESTSQTTNRTEDWIAQDGFDYYMLQFYNRGFRRILDRFEDRTARGGDLVTLDMTQTVSTMSSSYLSNDLVIPRRKLAPLLVYPDAHGGRVHDARLPLVSLLRSHLAALTEAAPKLTDLQMADLQPATIALVAATLNGVVSEDIAPEVRSSLLLPIRKFVDAHLRSPDLGLPHIAAQFGLSRSTVYRIMKPVGGVSAFILERRLRACRADLRRPELRHKTISEIMLGWGFSNPQSFSSMFRRAFGMSPRAFRQQSAVQKSVAATEIDSNWSRWIKELS
ncbi:helix-turn-helix domain-containing protein [Pseudogemmobacter lacusdianii]|uniref:helix-turn-helix domain-containing protein n=1 Tax=Pseudogemmobacter lacusdianii TaxID=3069608 RepID=UPI003593B443